MAYFCKRLNGFSKNTVRLNTQSSSTVNQNGVISITLPSNSIVDMKSLAMFFECVPDAKNAVGDTAGVAVYPRFTTSLIERIQVSVGGVAVGNAPNMNSALAYLKQVATMSPDKADSLPSLWASPQGFIEGAGGVLARGTGANQAQWQRGVQQVSPASVESATNNLCAVAAGGIPMRGDFPDEHRYCIELFNSFISESQPAYLDTSALGAIRMDILLSPAQVFLGVAADGTTAGQCNAYALNNIFCYVDVISVADGVYNSALAAYLAQGQSLRIPFANHFNFVDTITNFNTSLRVNVRSQNIRRVWNSWRRADYNNGTGDVANLALSATTPYFQFGTANNNSFQSIQLQINNVSCPSQPALAGTEVAYYNRKALNKMNNQLGAALADSYIDESTNHDLFYSVIGLDDRLSNGLRTLSGYSSAGTQTSIYVNLTQTAVALPADAPLQHLCIVECTSMLLVGQNRQITVIS
jgi:hypothetical protein